MFKKLPLGKYPKLAKFFLTFGYSGLIPIMPGTMGSLAALIPVLLINHYLSYQVAQTLIALGIVACFFAGVIVCHYYAQPLFGKEDPSSVVIDEVVGIWMATWLSDFSLSDVSYYQLGLIVVGFILFRLFDITKIAGIKRLEKIPGGWGVMLDDMAAGFISFLLVRGCEILVMMVI